MIKLIKQLYKKLKYTKSEIEIYITVIEKFPFLIIGTKIVFNQ